jgi:hypothetical protein
MKQIVGPKHGALLTVVLLVAVSPASADTGQDVLYGTGSVFSTLLYAPFKATFCILGGITSVFTLPFGGTQMAGKVASASCGGTWAITPNVLKGGEPVRFIGGEDSAQSSQHRTAPNK